MKKKRGRREREEKERDFEPPSTSSYWVEKEIRRVLE